MKSFSVIPLLVCFSGSSQLHLALLHSRELAVYLLSTEKNDQGLVYMLNLIYKHNLPRTAYNMTWGPFEGTKGTHTHTHVLSFQEMYTWIAGFMYCVEYFGWVCTCTYI